MLSVTEYGLIDLCIFIRTATVPFYWPLSMCLQLCEVPGDPQSNSEFIREKLGYTQYVGYTCL